MWRKTLTELQQSQLTVTRELHPEVKYRRYHYKGEVYHSKHIDRHL